MNTSSVLGAANVVLSTSAASHSLMVSQLRATGIAPLPGLGASPPKTTPPPGLDDSHQGPFMRAVRGDVPQTMMIVDDNTCGWISASAASPYLCNSGDKCVLVLADATSTGGVLCFNTSDELYKQGSRML
ncbi:hypothetical protein E4U17_000797 [Claviceps sp. LM77 group G4]|nr:hypothetical protein E4U17_000797 [Claviceps sp. LM77 group G4]KAG6068731.1 hypothetical protein E4U33_005006 [Claviceps sp. LM78 group G4]KAG6085105.1 hypothetical protein E4U16_007844 [Claviceps sp. LM84 group G4]